MLLSERRELGKTERLLVPSAAATTSDRIPPSTEALSTSPEILRAAEILRASGTVAFPTETVYGLGANALDAVAVAGIFTAKARPSWDPLIVHVADRALLAQIAVFPPDLEARIDTLIAAFWPGPLTLLLPRTAAIPDEVTAGRPLVGVRMPNHPVALALLRAAAVPVAAPSANRFGHTSPTTAAHVLDDLDGRIDAVLDGGPTAVGVESTVLDPTQTPMVLYRPGAVTAAMLTAATGCAVTVFEATRRCRSAREPSPSPGVGIRHYAPRARLLLFHRHRSRSLMYLAAMHARLGDSGGAIGKVGILLPDNWLLASLPVRRSLPGAPGTIRPVSPSVSSRRPARAGTPEGVDVILCPLPAGEGGGTRPARPPRARRSDGVEKDRAERSEKE